MRDGDITFVKPIDDLNDVKIVMPVDEEERLIHHMCECAPASIKSKGD
jgi:hypothetical protein